MVRKSLSDDQNDHEKCTVQNSNLANYIEQREVMSSIPNYNVISLLAEYKYMMIENNHEKLTMQNSNLFNLIKEGEVKDSIPNH